MTQAVCFACGELKDGAFNHCGRCERRPETDDDFVLSLALTDHFFKENVMRQMGELIRKGERLHLEESTRATALAMLNDFKADPFGKLVINNLSNLIERGTTDAVGGRQSFATSTDDADDDETEEMDNEKFGEELVDFARRVAREEISFALRPGVSRRAEQKEITPAIAETFSQDVLDLIARITKQEWTRSEAVLQEGGALSLVTDEDCEVFGLELTHVFRCGARDVIAGSSNSPPQEPETTVASDSNPRKPGLGLAGPKVSKAVPVAAFRVGPYEAALFSDIEAPGMIQYEHILVIYEKERSPLLYICAEWSRLQPVAEPRLYFLGLFQHGSHANLGHDEDIVDRNVFTLRAIESARKRLSLPTPSNLSEGEVIAITEMLKDLPTESGATEVRRARCGSVLRKYDAAIAEFLKTQYRATSKLLAPGDIAGAFKQQREEAARQRKGAARQREDDDKPEDSRPEIGSTKRLDVEEYLDNFERARESGGPVVVPEMALALGWFTADELDREMMRRVVRMEQEAAEPIKGADAVLHSPVAAELDAQIEAATTPKMTDEERKAFLIRCENWSRIEDAREAYEAKTGNILHVTPVLGVGLEDDGPRADEEMLEAMTGEKWKKIELEPEAKVAVGVVNVWSVVNLILFHPVTWMLAGGWWLMKACS